MENVDNEMKILDRRMQNYIVISVNSFGLARFGVALHPSAPILNYAYFI